MLSHPRDAGPQRRPLTIIQNELYTANAHNHPKRAESSTNLYSPTPTLQLFGEYVIAALRKLSTGVGRRVAPGINWISALYRHVKAEWYV